MPLRNNRQHDSSMDESGKSAASDTSTSRSRGKRRTLDWRPRTPDEILRRKNRKVINQYLKRIGGKTKLSLDNGLCCFSFNKFVICVEVPENNSSTCLFYALVCHLEPQDNRQEVQKFIRLYNNRHNINHNHNNNNNNNSSSELDASSASEESSTAASMDPLDIMNHGIRLCMSGDNHNNNSNDEVSLCLSFPIKGLEHDDFEDNLEHYLQICMGVNKKLNRARTTPVQPPEPILEESQQQQYPPCRLRMWSVDSQTSVSNMSQCSLFSLFGKGPSCAQLSDSQQS